MTDFLDQENLGIKCSKYDISLTLISLGCPQHNRLPPPPRELPRTVSQEDPDPDLIKEKNKDKRLSLCAQFLLCFLANGEFRYKLDFLCLYQPIV